jgi:hypothetical protein
MGPFVLVPYAMGLIADGIILLAQQLLPCLLRLCPLPRLFVDSCSSTDESERNLILGESSATLTQSRYFRVARDLEAQSWETRRGTRVDFS